MKIGNMVVRAYAYRAFVPGIIVDKETELIKPELDTLEGNEDYFEPYEMINYIVQWSDGSQSSELYEELDYLEDAIEVLHKALSG